MPAAIRRALAEATGGRPGVVHLDLPYDVSNAPLDAPRPDGQRYSVPLYRPAPTADDLARTVELLRGARRPLLVVGGGAVWSGAGAAVQALAERLGAPLVLSPTSRGLVAEDHPLCLGPSGIVGYPPASRALREADLLLGIGSRFSDLQTGRWTLIEAGVPIVQADLDPSEVGRHYPVAVGAACDARLFAEGLVAAIEGANLSADAERGEWTRSLRATVDDYRRTCLAEPTGDGEQVRPQEVVRTLVETLPRDAIVTMGAGDHGFWAALLPVYEPQAHLLSAGLGAMGCGLPLALGAKLARPERPVVAIVGDGDLMLQLQDLETMVREALPIVIVVFNNFQLGSQRPRMAATGVLTGVEHGNPDFAQLAQLFGAAGWRVDHPGAFGAALREALAADRPALIDVLLDPTLGAPRA